MTVKDFLVEKAQDFLAAHAAELETLLNEVRARRNAICGLHSVIPETVAGCSTAHLRDSLEKLCIGLQTFDLILQGLTKTIREPCRDLSPDEERACLIEQIAKYGVILPENIDFDSETLRNILHALDAVGSRVADCIRGLVPPAPSLGYEFTPAGAFRLIFDPDNRPLTFSYDANRASALTQAFSAGDESAGPNMPIARFNITLAYSTIFFEDGTRRPVNLP
jgi:hypothetical protein